jgi:septum site-determining protein MinC
MAQLTQALELKGRMLSTTRIRVLKADTQAIARDLALLAEKMPNTIKGMAAILEAEADTPVDLGLLVKQLKAYGIQAIGVAGPELESLAQKLGLPVLPRENPKAAAAVEVEPLAAAAPAASPAPAAAPPLHKPARIHLEPVRSGQQIYADGSDLIILNAVSAGAEVIADGCIHIYGSLRGRALAGALGNAQARIFASRFEAELVAVGRVYSLTEQIKSVPAGTGAQVRLHEGRLLIEALS